LRRYLTTFGAATWATKIANNDIAGSIAYFDTCPGIAFHYIVLNH
jgi:hypothetical protein